jgi:hypothetical protein
MLRNVVDEITRRRLWPIAAIALLVGVAAPLLLLKGSLAAAPSASTTAPAAPATPALETLPADAQRLLDSSDAPRAAARRRRDGNDPFQPPSSARAASSKDSAKSADTSADEDKSSDAPAAKDSTEPVPVVITDANGTPTSSGTATSPATPIDGGAATTTGSDASAVDVRFGPGFESPLHRAIPRRQTFVAGGRVVAIFVKYSPTRKKAVFAIAPTTAVGGDVDCRRKQGVCRYVDIAAGKYVRLTLRATDGTLVTRRLDVHRVRRGAQPASASPANGSCLLAKVLNLTADDQAPTADACRS